jgi:hypothetical protein
MLALKPVRLKPVRNAAVATLFALGLAACSEGPMAPVGISPDAAPLMSSGSSGRGQDAGSRVFTINPGVPVFEKLGDHLLTMPANVVCDPATSGYGVSFWDLPCAALDRPLQVTATWSERNGEPAVSFSPDLRFVPSDDASRWVNLSLKASKGIDPDLNYAILWFDTQSGQWIDESKTDPSLRARTQQSGNLVVRRLKHFSDYFLWVGLGSYNVTSGLGGDGDIWAAW